MWLISKKKLSNLSNARIMLLVSSTIDRDTICIKWLNTFYELFNNNNIYMSVLNWWAVTCCIILRTLPSTVPAAPPIRLPIPNPNPNPKPHPNPNPIFKPNPNPKNKKNKIRHRNKIQHRVIYIYIYIYIYVCVCVCVIFLRDGGGFIRGP